MTAATIRVLGCSGSIAAGSRTTSFLLDSDVLIDAGTGVGDLTLDELAAIDHIFVSHSHLDHVLSIGLLADSVARRRVDRPPIRVHALPATLDALRQHIFNGIIWPDFTRLPSAEQPMLAFEPFSVGDVLTLADRRIEVLPARHTVPAVGFHSQVIVAAGGPDGACRNPPRWVPPGGRRPRQLDHGARSRPRPAARVVPNRLAARSPRIRGKRRPADDRH
jgi:glyoxylase-like metal-dependent hydrolase (beta-lactamase superfamily II)